MDQSYYSIYEKEFKKILKGELKRQEINPLREFSTQKLVEYTSCHWKSEQSSLGQQQALVVGCGDGGSCFELAQRGYQVTGLDYSPCAIELAKDWQQLVEREKSREERNQIGAIRFERGDFLSWSQSATEKQFHLILDDHLLHCLPLDPHRQLYWQAVAKGLAPGGQWVGELMTYDHGCRFSSLFLLDEKSVLWKKAMGAEERELREAVTIGSGSFKGESYYPYRYIPSAHQWEREILESGLKIDYFRYHSQLKFEILGNGTTPHCHWPGVMHVVASAQ